MFNYLKGKEVTILGHDNIDVDSCISGILLSKLFTFLGIKNKFIILDKKIDKDTYNCLLKLGYDLNKFQSNSISESVFLVDHHITTHSNNVVGCIDHHPTIQELDNYKFYINYKSSSCAKLIYDLMESSNYPLTKEDALLTIHSIFFDTCSLTSTKLILSDKNWAIRKIKEFGFDYDEVETDGFCLTDLGDNINTLSKNGMKEYCYKNQIVKSSYIQVNYNISDIRENKINPIITYLSNIVKNTNIYLWVFLIVDFKNMKTYEYQIYEHKTIEKIHNGILSRGIDIMPKIEQEIYKK